MEAGSKRALPPKVQNRVVCGSVSKNRTLGNPRHCSATNNDQTLLPIKSVLSILILNV